MNKNWFKSIIIISIIILLGLFLRLIGINKPYGLWHDEMVIYTQSIKSFPLGIIDWTLLRDTHFPLFQLLLHLWINLFGNNDITLRLFSVLMGVANIFVIYLAGKEIDSKKTGIIAALALSINSLSIYYSQEVKFYSFLPLFATISALFLIKIIKNPSKLNYWGFILSNLVICYTFTIGIVYVFIEIAILSVYLYFKQKDNLKKLLQNHLYFLILLVPIIFMFLEIMKFDKQDFTGGFTAFHQDIQFIIVILQNWFTPMLVGLISNPIKYFNIIFNSHHIFMKCIFILIPILIYLLGVINAIRQKNYKIILFIIPVSFLLIEILATVFTRFVCITRYTIIGLPLIILFASYGLSKIKNKWTLYSIISIFTLLNLFYILVYPFSAPKMQRQGGHKLASIALSKSYNFKKDDILIFPLRETLFNKYADINGIKLSVFRDFIINREFLKTIINPAKVDKLNANNCQNIFKKYMYKKNISKQFDTYFNNHIYSKIPQNGVFVVIINRNMTYTKKSYKYVLSQDQYLDAPFIFMSLTKVSYDIIKMSNKYFRLKHVVYSGPWELYIYKKT
ncbi:MAG: glycosyltransferase family 39 protein [Candidatus Gastranaerophilales bacterium]|nr:glycosyltransferase family 39 protein [Candidatus Gastranaerophilales bacterium]